MHIKVQRIHYLITGYQIGFFDLLSNLFSWLWNWADKHHKQACHKAYMMLPGGIEGSYEWRLRRLQQSMERVISKDSRFNIPPESDEDVPF
jgi:hypothetical protein